MNPYAIPFSVGARVAGSIIAIGYLVGFAPASVVSVMGALALITFGRALVLDRSDGFIAAAALALLATAVGIGTLRWGVVDLDVLRGAQAVIGPTVLLEPVAAATASWIAVAAGTIGLGGWMVAPAPAGRAGVLWWGVEGLLGALALVSVYWGPKASLLSGESGGPIEELGPWAVAVVAVVVPAALLAFLLRRLRIRWRFAALALSGVALVAAGGLIVSAL